MSNTEAARNPDLITGPIIGSKSLFAAPEGALFKEICLVVNPDPGTRD